MAAENTSESFIEDEADENFVMQLNDIECTERISFRR